MAADDAPTLVDVPPRAPALRAPRVPSFSAPDHTPESAPEVSPSSWRGVRAADRIVGAIVEGRYRVEGLLAEGGMGVVYRARHTVLEKPVAIKVMHPDLASRPGAAERFLAEARAVSGICSPYVIDVVDFGTMPDGLPYLVMEYLEGPPLSALLRSGALGLARAIEVASQIAEGLEPAHAAGIVHRDLKPDNVLVLTRNGRDHVKVLDFGVAKVNTGTSDPAPGCVVGTPHYMSPEQAIGAEVDGRADIYSLGVMLYAMVTGSLPFQAASARRVMELHVTTPPAPPSSHVCVGRDIPAPLEALILDCLAKDPARRPPSMHHVRTALEQVKAAHVPRVVVTPEPPRALAPVDSWPTLADSPRARPSNPQTASGAPPDALRESEACGDEATTKATVRQARPQGPARAGAWHRLGGMLVGMVGLGLAASMTVIGGEQAAADHAASASAHGRVEVAVLLSPLDAEVFHGGQSLGRMPITVEVPRGGAVELEARCPGYSPRRFVVDGTRTRVEVELDRADLAATR